jgi:chemotaxis protein MotB
MRMIALALALSLTAGCVSKKKYAELEDMYNTALEERDQAAADRDRALDSRKELQAKIDKRVQAFGSVYKDLMKVQKKGLAKVKVEDGRAVLQLESDVLFDSGSAELTAGGRDTVGQIAKILANQSSARFQVEGHTDADPIDSKEFPTNWHLGADRAINVTLAMVEAGFPADRVSAASLGDTMPVASNDSDAGKAQNRRIELVLVPELSELLPYKRVMKEMKQGDGEGGGKKKGK